MHCDEATAGLPASRTWGTNLPLTHGAPFGKLGDILRSEALLSQAALGRAAGKAEAVMETVDDVFLYASALSYPNTECGFLFLASVEDDHSDDGVATPFDSGAFAGHVPHPASYSDGVSFVRDHEFPVSNYREGLSAIIAGYHREPVQYLTHPETHECRCGEPRAHPSGVSGGDRRASIFEVRIPKRVALQPPHLRAVFVRQGYEIPELARLFAAGVTIEYYEPSDGADFFHAMRECCISFIRTHILP